MIIFNGRNWIDLNQESHKQWTRGYRINKNQCEATPRYALRCSHVPLRSSNKVKKSIQINTFSNLILGQGFNQCFLFSIFAPKIRQMTTNRTFTMIKPDAVENGHIGNIIDMVTSAGFEIKAMKYTRLSKEQAQRNFMLFMQNDHFTESWFPT